MKKNDDIYVKCSFFEMKHCKYKGCTKQPTFNVEGEKAEYCAEHKLAGMIDVKHQRCKHKGCTTIPSFNIEGEKAEYCAEHKLDGMVNVINKRCKYKGCTTFSR